MNVKVIGLLIISIVCLSGCSQGNSESAKDVPIKTIAFEELEPFLTFKSDSIAGPASIKFLSDDTIAVLDSKLSSVLLYDTEGHLLDRFGRKGKGPGEFANPVSIRVTENHIFVLDFAVMGIHEFKPDGNYVTTHTFDGNMLGFIHTSVLGAGQFLSTANGKDGYLLRYKSSSDSSFYFGKAIVKPSETINIGRFKKQVENGEIPDLFKNSALTDYGSESFYAFLQSFSRLQKYSRSGVLLWEKDITLPVNQKIYDHFLERNSNMQANAIYPLSYASQMQVIGKSIYVLMNAPAGEPQVLVRLDAEGNMRSIYQIGSKESEYNNFVINPSQKMLYLTDFSMGCVYKTKI